MDSITRWQILIARVSVDLRCEGKRDEKYENGRGSSKNSV